MGHYRETATQLGESDLNIASDQLGLWSEIPLWVSWQTWSHMELSLTGRQRQFSNLKHFILIGFGVWWVLRLHTHGSCKTVWYVVLHTLCYSVWMEDNRNNVEFGVWLSHSHTLWDLVNWWHWSQGSSLIWCCQWPPFLAVSGELPLMQSMTHFCADQESVRVHWMGVIFLWMVNLPNFRPGSVDLVIVCEGSIHL